MSNRVKHIIGLSVVGLAVVYLMWSAFMGSYKYVLTPSEFLAKESEHPGAIVKLTGMVVKGSTQSSGSVYQFEITDGGKTIKVIYDGVMPNSYQEEADVIVGGTYDPEKNVFVAGELMTKCASKYKP